MTTDAAHDSRADGVRQQMAKHRELLLPKFALVLQILDDRLGGAKVASWTEPEGGYFVSLDVIDGTATKVIELAKTAGISLTSAGSRPTTPRQFDHQHAVAGKVEQLPACCSSR